MNEEQSYEESDMQPVAPRPEEGPDQEPSADNSEDLVPTERNTYISKETGIEIGKGELDPGVKAHPRRRRSVFNLTTLAPGQFMFLPGRTKKSVASAVSQNNTRYGPHRVEDFNQRKIDGEDVNPFLPIEVIKGQANVIKGWEAPESGVVIYCRY